MKIMMKYTPLNNPSIDHYVILVSEHNMAEFRACLFLQPKNIHMIITKSMIKPAKRLATVLEKNGFDIHAIGIEKNIQEITENDVTLEGECAQEIISWVAQTFRPYAKKHFKNKKGAILNMTGGTKSLASVLIQALRWRNIHYMPFMKNKSELILESITFHKGKKFKKIEHQNINKEFNLLDGLRLYVDNISEQKPNKINQHKDSIAIAQLRFDAQKISKEQATPENLFPIITPILEKIWYKDSKQYPEKIVSIPWSEFLDKEKQPFDIFIPPMKAFFEKIYALDNNTRTLKINDTAVEIPTEKSKCTSWIRWISGFWFEQLIESWFLDIIDTPENLKTGVLINKSAADKQETDILTLKNNQLIFVELKADISENYQQELKKFINKLSSQTSDVGKIKRAFIFSPIIQYKLEENQYWKRFCDICKSKYIDVIIAENADSLKQLVNPKSTQLEKYS